MFGRKKIQQTTPVVEDATIETKRSRRFQRLRFLPRSVWVFFVLALAINAATWAYLLVQMPPTDATVYLHYTIYFGIDYTGQWWKLLLIPGTGLAILVVNSAVLLMKRATDTPVLLVTTFLLTTCMQAMIAVATYFIIVLNKTSL